MKETAKTNITILVTIRINIANQIIKAKGFFTSCAKFLGFDAFMNIKTRIHAERQFTIRTKPRFIVCMIVININDLIEITAFKATMFFNRSDHRIQPAQGIWQKQ